MKNKIDECLNVKKLNKRPENRLTVVNEEGRVCEFWNVDIQESIQDNGRTLKLFLNKKIGCGKTVNLFSVNEYICGEDFEWNGFKKLMLCSECEKRAEKLILDNLEQENELIKLGAYPAVGKVEKVFKSLGKEIDKKVKCVADLTRLYCTEPPQYKCIHCGQFWYVGQPAPDCKKQCRNNQSQRKEDKDDGSNDTLSGDTKQLQGKTKKDEHMPVSVDNHADDEDTLEIQKSFEEIGKIFNELAQTLNPLLNIQTVPARVHPEDSTGEQ